MPENHSDSNQESTIPGLYPNLSPEQLVEAEYYLLRYLEVTKRIFERICREQPEVLTELEKRARLKRETGELL